MTYNQRNAILVRWVKSCETDAQLNNLLKFIRKFDPFAGSALFYCYTSIGKEMKIKYEEISIR